MAGEQGVLELRHDGVLVAEHAVEQRLAGGDPGHGVAPDLLLDRRRLPARCLQIAEGGEHELPWIDHTDVRGIIATGRRPRRILAVVDLSGQWRATVADDELRRSAVGLDYDDDDWARVAGARPLAQPRRRSPTATAR